MTSLKIAAWNVEGRLSPRGSGRRGSPKHIAQNIIALRADIIFLPESCHANGMAPDIEYVFEEAGYQVFTQQYHDSPELMDTDYTLRMALLVRRSLGATVKIVSHRLGGIRQSMFADFKFVGGKRLHVFGLHLHDKNEQLRLAMVQDVIRYVKKVHTPCVMLGDFNAMDGALWRSKMVRTRFFKKLTAAIPHQKVKYLLERVSEMARGDSLAQLLLQTGLQEVNIKRKASITPKTLGLEWLPSIRLITIDHILISPGMVFKDFKVSGDGGADHRAISGHILL